VFNIADASISTGVISIFVFQKVLLKKNFEQSAVPQKMEKSSNTDAVIETNV
jgi:lipoprotein signal peptidase